MPKPPHLSPASDGLSSSVYTSLLGIAQAEASEVFALNVGDTYLLPPSCARAESLRVDFLPQLHNYAAVQGEPGLLHAIAEDAARNGRPLGSRLLQVTAGATSGLDIACRTLFSHEDEIIVLSPYWPLIRGIVLSSGARIVELPFFTELARPDFDIEAALKSVVSERTAGLYVNQPNNPTGAVLSDAQVSAIAHFAQRHNLWVLEDAAYQQLSFSNTPLASLYQNPSLADRTITANTFSKSLGLAGARVGYLHGPERAMTAISGLQTFATYCAPKPMQLGIAHALQSGEGAEWAARARASYREAALRVSHMLGLPCPESGTFSFFDTRPFLRAGESPSQWLERCARAGVVLTPGSATGAAFGAYARLCFTSVPLETLDRALLALAKVLHGVP